MEKICFNKNFIGMKSFGASGPYKELFEHFEITPKALVKLIKERIK
jgi:Transketolase